MKVICSITRFLKAFGLAGVFAWALQWVTMPAGAATIWNGPIFSFTEAGGSDPTLPANQDRLTANVWLTRGLIQGLFNAKSEGGYTHNFSPAGTEWAYGQLSDYASLTYDTWEGWFGGRTGGGPGTTVGKDAVLHLIIDDIYLSVKFTSFGSAGTGFAYDRSTPSVPEPSSVVLMLAATGIVLTVRRHGRMAHSGS